MAKGMVKGPVPAKKEVQKMPPAKAAAVEKNIKEPIGRPAPFPAKKSK